MRAESLFGVWLLCLGACQPIGPLDSEDSEDSADPSASERSSGLALRVQSVLGEDAAGADFARAELPRAFEFPRDHGPHPQFRSEWWYLTAALKDAMGRDYGVQFTMFRQALGEQNPSDNAWRTDQVYLGHLAITDVAGDTHREAQRIARGRRELAGVSATPFAAWIDGWEVRSPGTSLFPMELVGATTDFGVQLTLKSGKRPVAQGEMGLSRKGPDNASYYYSLPRIPIVGTLSVDGQRVSVEGLGWMDREWSTSVLGDGVLGWDWFGLHLDDGADLMAFRLRRADGERDPYDAALWVNAEDVSETLGYADFELTPQRLWQDDQGRSWPVTWLMTCARCGDGLRIEAALDDQRMDTAITYWEGLVLVSDQSGARRGSGYMELTGY